MTQPLEGRGGQPAEITPPVVEADAVLAEVAASFDHLLYVSPNNSAEAWQQFSASSFREEPRFTYVDIDVDVDGLRRRVEGVRIDAIDDAALARLLEGKRQELLHHLGLLVERGTPAFLRRSIALSGRVDEELSSVADRVLAWADGAVADVAEEPTVSPTAFVGGAEEEIGAYRLQDPAFTASVQVRDDITSLLVVGNRLMVPAHRAFFAHRVQPLLHHEVGVHVLTWWNGHAQPLRMLADGLGGYLEAQEGLGVVAELLSGGMTRARLRELAARVVAARTVIDGATFMETFTELHEVRGLPAERAFDVTDRAHRGGGLVKDLVYLRGLVRLIAHLQQGGAIDPFLLGKPSLEDLADVQSLLDRGVLLGPRLYPRWLLGDGAGRLAELRAAPDPASVLMP